jgi:hypothetical protein
MRRRCGLPDAKTRIATSVAGFFYVRCKLLHPLFEKIRKITVRFLALAATIV